MSRIGSTVLLTCAVLALLCVSHAGGQQEQSEDEDRLFFRGNNDTQVCGVGGRIANRCLAESTGYPNITIGLIISYIVDIYQFLTRLNITALKILLENLEKVLNPIVSTAQLTCACPKPLNATAGYQWTCQATAVPALAVRVCQCTNIDADNAECTVTMHCPPSQALAFGGRCQNDVSTYETGQFQIQDIGYGIPNGLGIPTYTTCNIQVSRNVSEVRMNAFAYCKPL